MNPILKPKLPKQKNLFTQTWSWDIKKGINNEILNINIKGLNIDGFHQRKAFITNRQISNDRID